jgi:hypothetical protein
MGNLRPPRVITRQHLVSLPDSWLVRREILSIALQELSGVVEKPGGTHFLSAKVHLFFTSSSWPRGWSGAGLTMLGRLVELTNAVLALVNSTSPLHKLGIFQQSPRDRVGSFLVSG